MKGNPKIIVIDEGNLLSDSEINIYSQTNRIELYSFNDFNNIYKQNMRDVDGILPELGRIEFDFYERYASQFKGQTYRW